MSERKCILKMVCKNKQQKNECNYFFAFSMNVEHTAHYPETNEEHLHTIDSQFDVITQVTHLEQRIIFLCSNSIISIFSFFTTNNRNALVAINQNSNLGKKYIENWNQALLYIFVHQNLIEPESQIELKTEKL